MTEWFASTMEKLLDFSNILNASIAASWMVLAVIILRYLLKKAPRWTHVALWGLVAVRMLLPFSIESAFSLIPSKETVPHEILVYEGTRLEESAFLDVVSNPVFSGSVTVELGETVDRVQISLVKMTPIWIVGIAVLLLYTAISYWRLRRKVIEATILRENIYQSENVASPFVLGIIKPTIYLPYGMNEQDLGHVVAHEQAHIRRRDHWWKPLGFFLLTIHWFNPLMWLAYVLLCRDIELACDEKVIKELGDEQRADYTQALVVCSVNRRMIAACPLAFGEVGVKERVKSVMNYKKPAFWIIVLSVIVCAAVSVCFLTNPVSSLDFGNIESVTVDSIRVSDEAADELVSLINSYRRTYFMVGLDDPNSLSRAIQINCANGDFYLLHYQYYSGFSFDPRRAGEDDYRSILTFFKAGEGGQKAWKLEYDFDAELREWLSKYATPNFGALTVNLPFCVVEVTYETPLMEYSSVAQVNTPEYMLDENKHFYSVKQHSDATNWTDLGELSEITLTRWNFDEIFRRSSGEGWLTRQSAAEIRRNTAKSWCVIFNQDQLYYVLQQNNGELYLAQGYYDYSEKNDPYSDDTSIHRLYKIAPIEKQESSKHEENTITNIIDPTKDGNFAYDTAMEKFFEDESNEYFFSGIYSQFVIVHYADGTQEDIVTALNSGRATLADLDRFGIRYWAESKGEPLEDAISSAILRLYRGDEPDGLIHVESHVLLANEVMSGTPLFGADDHAEKVIVYLLVYHVKYSTYGGELEAVGGSYIPTAITFKVSESGEYVLEEYWEPRDGIYYADDIRKKFPGVAADDALNDQAYIEELKTENYNKALAYLNSHRSLDAIIEELLGEIQSSPAHSSNPGDYIREHDAEYQELLSYGEYTLQYCFSEFLRGSQYDLRGHIMAQACEDIMLAWGEACVIDGTTFTGQDWFDEFRRNAESLAFQFSDEMLEKYYPASWLLLELINALTATQIEEIALAQCKVNFDYIRTEFIDSENVWSVEFWESSAKVPSQTVIINLDGIVLENHFAE